MIDRATRAMVRERARLRCEYCLLAESNSPMARLQIEHIRPRKHGGDDAPENLALACIDCNLRKGSNLTGIDPLSGVIVPLFHPRNQAWTDHFLRVGPLIEGATAVGRTTVVVLDLNSADRLQARLAIG